STLITGIAAQTLASKRSCTPAADAAANSSAPRRATSCLLAVTTCLPRESSSSTCGPAGSRPPITSATTSIPGSSAIAAKSSVSTPSAGRCARSFPASRTSAFTTRSRCPVARSMSSADSVRRRSTAAPTVPYPSRATLVSTDAMDLRGHRSLVERAQPGADLLDLRRRELPPLLLEDRLPPVHLGDPFPRERAVPDRREHRAHVLAHVLVDDLRADRVRSVLGGVGDRVVHPLDPTLPDQVDDQLQLVQALVVGDLRLVARLHERLEAELDQLGDAAAEHRLLAEEVGLRLLGERRLDHADAAGADRRAVGERELPGAAARVLRDGDHGRRAVALGVEPADDVARPLRRDHDHV